MTALNERGERAARSTVAFTLANYSGMAASFVSVPLLLRWLGAENYGLMLTALAFMSYLSFADAGLNWGSIVLISEAHGRGDRGALASVFRHSIVLGLGSALVALVGATLAFTASRAGWQIPIFGGHTTGTSLLLIVGLQCAVSLSVAPVYAVFQGMQEGHWVGFYIGCSRVVSTGVILLAVWWWRSPAAALLAGLVVLAFFGAIAYVHAWRSHSWLFARGDLTDRTQYRRQLRIGAKSFGLQVARTIQGTAPVLVLGAIAGPASVPLYSVPAALAGALFGIFNSWNSSVQAAYGASWAANDRGWVVSVFRRTLDLTVIIGTVAAAGFVIVGPAAVELWTHGALPLTSAMCASVVAIALVQAVSASVQFCLVGINQHRDLALIELVHTACAFGGAALATLWWGPAGVGIGITAAYLATAAWLGFRDLARRLGTGDVVPRAWWLARVVLVGASGLLVGLAWLRFLPGDSLLPHVVRAGLGAVLASGTVVAGTVLLRLRSLTEWRASFNRSRLVQRPS